MSHQVELKNRLKHLSYTEQLYIAVQTNAIASVQNLLTKKNPKNPKASTNDKCFYSASYYRVPQTDEFAALASQKGTKDQESKNRQRNSEGSRTTTYYSEEEGSDHEEEEDLSSQLAHEKHRYDDIERWELAFVSWSSNRKCCTRCWSLTSVVAMFGPILALTFTIASDERFLMDSAAQTVSAVWGMLLLLGAYVLWLLKESLTLHNGDVTPLQLAVLFGRHELVKVLCQEPFYGDPTITNDNGYDCFALAKSLNRQDVNIEGTMRHNNGETGGENGGGWCCQRRRPSNRNSGGSGAGVVRARLLAQMKDAVLKGRKKEFHHKQKAIEMVQLNPLAKKNTPPRAGSIGGGVDGPPALKSTLHYTVTTFTGVVVKVAVPVSASNPVETMTVNDILVGDVLDDGFCGCGCCFFCCGGILGQGRGWMLVDLCGWSHVD